MGVVDSIKASPNWRFILRPEPYVENRLERGEALRAIRKATVQFRGWDFPHLNPHEKPAVGANYVASSDEFMGHLEYWRVFTSGQFIYLSSVREVSEPGWHEKLAKGAAHRIAPPTADYSWSSTPGFIEVGNLIYTLTGFVEFSARYAQALASVDEVVLSVSLSGVGGFVLAVDDARRGWWEFYQATDDSLSMNWSLELAQIVTGSRDLAFDVIRWFLAGFGWLNVNEDSIRKEIDDFAR
jgi:hypothetical protein